MRKPILTILATAALVAPAVAQAATRSVSSASALSSAVAAANPGDEIVVAGGTYSVNLMITRDGTSSSPITLRAATGATVVLTAKDTARRTVELSDASHWRIDGLKMRGSQHAIVRITGGTDNTIRNCEIYDGSKKGIIANGDLITIEHCTIRDIKQPRDGEDTQGIAAWRASRLRIRDNVIATPGDGILIGGAGSLSKTSTDVRIYRNHFHALDAWYGKWHVENAIDIKNVDGLVISDNEMHHYIGRTDDDPTGCAVNIITRDPEVNGYIANVRFERNKIWDVNRGVSAQGADGPGRKLFMQRNVFYNVLEANGPSTKMPAAVHLGDWSEAKVENNTFVDVDYATVHAYGSLTGLFFRNNILKRAAAIKDKPSAATVDYTCRYESDSTGGSHDVVANPRFVDDAGRDYHLTSSSPCIDHGLNIGLPFVGTKPDMGRYEYDPNSDSLMPDEGDAPAPPNADGRPVDWASQQDPRDITERHEEPGELGPPIAEETAPGAIDALVEEESPPARVAASEEAGPKVVPIPSAAAERAPAEETVAGPERVRRSPAPDREKRREKRREARASGGCNAAGGGAGALAAGMVLLAVAVLRRSGARRSLAHRRELPRR